MSCWHILQIKETADIKQIKRAYAKLIKQYSPEDDPIGFQRIREAFDEAKKEAAYIKEHEPDDYEEVSQQTSVEESTVEGGRSSDDQVPSIEKSALSDSKSYQLDSEYQLDGEHQRDQANQIEQLAIAENVTASGDLTENLHESVNSTPDDEAAERDASLQHDFWTQFDLLLQNSQAKVEDWKHILRHEVLYNLEFKQALHYNVFERILHAISENQDGHALGLNQNIIRTLSEGFGWQDNELELANYFGYDGVELVMEYRSNSERKRRSVLSNLHDDDSHSKSPWLSAVAWILLLAILFFAVSIMNHDRQDKQRSDSKFESSRTSSPYVYDRNGSKESFSYATDVEVTHICKPLLSNGLSTRENKETLERCTALASKGNQEYAALYLGAANLLETFEEAAPEQAMYWLNQSSNQGNEQAAFFLGVLLDETRSKLSTNEDAAQILQQADTMGSRFAYSYWQSSIIEKQPLQSELDKFRLAMKTSEFELGNTSLVANAYSNLLSTHKKSAIPHYNLDQKSVDELLLLMSPVIEEGSELERSRLLMLLLAYTDAYLYDAQLKAIADSFVTERHDYANVETYLWVAAFKAYIMDFGAANAILDMGLIKLERYGVFIEPDFKEHLLATARRQKAAYKAMETLHIPVDDIQMQQIAREVKKKLKSLAVEELRNG